MDKIVANVCEESGLKWEEAQQFIEHVRQEHGDAIRKRQLPLNLSIAILSILVGLFIAGGMISATLNGIIIFFLALPIPYLGNALIIGSGIAMIGGGVLGFMKNGGRDIFVK